MHFAMDVRSECRARFLSVFGMNCSLQTYKYELTGNYSSHVRKRPAVADQVFPELLRRILDRPDLTREEDLDNQIITVYQIIHYLEASLDMRYHRLRAFSGAKGGGAARIW